MLSSSYFLFCLSSSASASFCSFTIDFAISLSLIIFYLIEVACSFRYSNYFYFLSWIYIKKYAYILFVFFILVKSFSNSIDEAYFAVVFLFHLLVFLTLPFQGVDPSFECSDLVFFVIDLIANSVHFLLLKRSIDGWQRVVISFPA